MIDISNATMRENNTHIVDSYTVRTKEDMRIYLNKLRDLGMEQMAVNCRDLESQVREWRAHNFFYDLHVFRGRTRDVDLELKQVWWRELFCRVVNFFYFWDSKD